MSKLQEQRRLMGLEPRPMGPWAQDAEGAGPPDEEIVEATQGPWVKMNRALKKAEKDGVSWIKTNVADRDWKTSLTTADKNYPYGRLEIYLLSPEGVFEKNLWDLTIYLTWTASLSSDTDPKFKARIRLEDKQGQVHVEETKEEVSAADIKDLKNLLLLPNKKALADAFAPGAQQKKSLKDLRRAYKDARQNLVSMRDKIEVLSQHLEKSALADVKDSAQELYSMELKLSSAIKKLRNSAATAAEF